LHIADSSKESITANADVNLALSTHNVSANEGKFLKYIFKSKCVAQPIVEKNVAIMKESEPLAVNVAISEEEPEAPAVEAKKIMMANSIALEEK
jgi:hypothetical protein